MGACRIISTDAVILFLHSRSILMYTAFIKNTAIMSLTPNAVSRMFDMGASQDDPSFRPTVQVIHLKQIDSKGGEDRFKVSSNHLHSLEYPCSPLNVCLKNGTARPLRWHPSLQWHERHPTKPPNPLRRNHRQHHYQNHPFHRQLYGLRSKSLHRHGM